MLIMTHEQKARDLYNQLKGMVATTKTFEDLENLKVKDFYTFNKSEDFIDVQLDDLVGTVRKGRDSIFLENKVIYYTSKDTCDEEYFTF